MFHMQSSDYFHTEKVGRPNPGCSADTYSSAVWLADVAGEDLMRCKLAFFGASRFDPRSDKWVRISLFQNEPYPSDLNAEASASAAR